MFPNFGAQLLVFGSISLKNPKIWTCRCFLKHIQIGRLQSNVCGLVNLFGAPWNSNLLATLNDCRLRGKGIEEDIMLVLYMLKLMFFPHFLPVRNLFVYMICNPI